MIREKKEKKTTSRRSSSDQMKGYLFQSDHAIGFHDRWQIFIGQLILCQVLVAEMNVPTHEIKAISQAE